MDGVGPGLDAFGLSFGNDDEDPVVRDSEPPAGGRGRFLSDGTPAADDEGGSSISREIAETGYFWNLTPNPSAEDPMAESITPDEERPSDFPATGWD